jgi:hypothetical protein
MNKPNFTGTWTFNASKSELQITPPDATVFVVDHREPMFRLSRTHIAGGKSDTFEIELTTDGAEVVGEHGQLHFRSCAHWEGETLVFESHLVQGDETGTNVVKYTLDDTRDTLIAEERLRSTNINYDNRWILDKQH